MAETEKTKHNSKTIISSRRKNARERTQHRDRLNASAVRARPTAQALPSLCPDSEP